MSKKLMNKLALITSDNDSYDQFRDKFLRITHVAHDKNEHPGYDDSMNGQALCDFVVEGTNENVPFSLYEYEFEIQ